MIHFKNQCECGVIISQCKCIGDKQVNIVSPCEHTTTSTRREGVPTIEELEKAYHELVLDDNFVKKFKCSPEMYIKLKKHLIDQGISTPAGQVVYFTAVFGIDVEVDVSMGENEWRFE